MSLNNSDVVTLEKNSSNICKIHLFGATLISWISDNEEYIFVSSKAKFDNKTAIRGGIPIVFPNFGPWTQGPQHGFARTSRWSVDQAPEKGSDGEVKVVLSLEDNEHTRTMWDHRFRLLLTVTLMEKKLKMNFDVENRGSTPFSFTCLLHTYFRVPDVQLATVDNIRGLTYLDKIKGGGAETETRDILKFDQLTDSIYENTPSEHRISNVTGNRKIVLQKENFPDTVIWNPWREKALQMSDLGEDYVHLLCVEAGRVTTPVELQENGKFHASQTLTII